MSRRAEQVASVLGREIQAILSKGLADPRIQGMITVTGVRLGDDLGEAVVNVSILPEAKQDLALHGLRAAARHIARQASNRLEFRRTPNLVFKLDRGAKKEAAVLEAISEIRRERESREAQHTSPADAPPLAQTEEHPD